MIDFIVEEVKQTTIREKELYRISLYWAAVMLVVAVLSIVGLTIKPLRSIVVVLMPFIFVVYAYLVHVYYDIKHNPEKKAPRWFRLEQEEEKEDNKSDDIR